MSVIDAPQIQRVDVVLRQLGPDDFCQSSKKYRGLDFCFKDGQMTKYSYEPDVFSKATGADIDSLQAKIDKCPVCKTGLPISMSPPTGDRYRWTNEISEFLSSFLRELAQENGVPPPHTVLGSCPPNIHGHKTCNDSSTNTIYIHPLDAGPQAAAHEFKHYLNDKQGRMQLESEAAAFARAVVTKKFPTGHRLPTTLNTTAQFYGYSKVQISMFEELDRYYNYVAPHLKVTGNLMNIAWTPEFIATAIEVAENMVFSSPFLRMLTDLGVAIGGIAAGVFTPNLTTTDKAILHNIASHMSMRALKRPMADMGLMTTYARDFGRAVATFDMRNILGSFGVGAQRVMQDIQIAAASLGRQVGFGVPAPMVVPSAADVLSSVAGLTTYAPFSIDVTAKTD